MKKPNQSQARKRSSRTASRNQSRKSQPQGGQAGQGPITIRIVRPGDGTEAARFDVPWEVYDALHRLALARGVPLQTIVEEAVTKSLAPGTGGEAEKTFTLAVVDDISGDTLCAVPIDHSDLATLQSEAGRNRMSLAALLEGFLLDELARARAPQTLPAQGWAESQGLKPGSFDEAYKPQPVRGSATIGWSLPLPGLADLARWTEPEITRHLAAIIVDTQHVLAAHVLPKLRTAYETAEFADLLWTGHAIWESSDAENKLENRNCLDLPKTFGPESADLFRFLIKSLCRRAHEITKYAIPHAGPLGAARLADALAIAEWCSGKTIDPLVSSPRPEIENPTPLQQQAWDARARAWLWGDLWNFENEDLIVGRDGYGRDVLP
ncbi:MAG: hypothetical protein QOF48_1522 [Verrucomicrobiota bacterium]|jgi:hypothetical protein